MLAQPTRDRHYRLPIFDHTTKIDAWFSEITILIEGPYCLHYDYAEQYNVIQKHHASEPNSPRFSLKDLYKRQHKHFPINMKHLVLFLPDFSCKVDMQRRYLTLIHYLCHHSNKFSGQCYKTIPQIQSALCISQPTLHRMIMTLESYDWLATQYTSVQRYDTKYKAPKTPTKTLTLTPIFWACISGMPINGNLVKQAVIPAMQAVHNCWGMDSREYKEMSSYPFIRHVAQIQHVTKFYQTAIRESELNVVRNDSLKQLSLMKYR
ncbi:hypothetical protein MD535_16410 [Vibrio sp. ZSDZ65]|uniref:Helix-turn-helix domain-containing protein n=1 Tax=Vibrio qingdaonensis TaxID=2829491 RepID=A0A9X3HXC5_9VIBR|nr:hypothetical protein [Vibrio qingdaonensis]MCW8347585.1 hypothetical protein [Vibrio qingdaonensis]